jgi:hypothetical protein
MTDAASPPDPFAPGQPLSEVEDAALAETDREVLEFARVHGLTVERFDEKSLEVFERSDIWGVHGVYRLIVPKYAVFDLDSTGVKNEYALVEISKTKNFVINTSQISEKSNREYVDLLEKAVFLTYGFFSLGWTPRVKIFSSFLTFLTLTYIAFTSSSGHFLWIVTVLLFLSLLSFLLVNYFKKISSKEYHILLKSKIPGLLLNEDSNLLIFNFFKEKAQYRLVTHTFWQLNGELDRYTKQRDSLLILSLCENAYIIKRLKLDSLSRESIRSTLNNRDILEKGEYKSTGDDIINVKPSLLGITFLFLITSLFIYLSVPALNAQSPEGWIGDIIARAFFPLAILFFWVTVGSSTLGVTYHVNRSIFDIYFVSKRIHLKSYKMNDILGFFEKRDSQNQFVIEAKTRNKKTVFTISDTDLQFREFREALRQNAPNFSEFATE